MSTILESPSANQVINRLKSTKTCRPYSRQTQDFMGQLSWRLLRDPNFVRRFPDGAAFGHWIRSKNLRDAAQRLSSIESLEGGMRVARGLSLHIAPGNVEALFAYSWAAATLAGCSSVVRVTSQRSELTDVLITAVEQVAGELEYERRWEFVSWDTTDASTLHEFSAAADVLVFWGGNTTVTELSRAPRQPHARLITFPDRESLAVVDGRVYLDLTITERNALAQKLRKDLMSFGQAACSSTRFICWIGDANTGFEDLLERITASKSDEPLWEMAERMQRRTYAFQLASTRGGICASDEQEDILVLRAEGAVSRDFDHPGCGTVVAVRLDSLVEVETMLRGTDQTLCYFGFSPAEFRSWLATADVYPRRLVPIGAALDFSDRWDGMDLQLEFTELVTIE